jgi:hypothetical protein
MSFAQGVAAGMAAGAVAVTVGKVMLDNRKIIGKGSAKAVRAVSDFISGVQTMMK